MEKIYSTPVKNYIQRNGFVMVSNLLLDFQQELGITESELSFIIKIMKNKNGYAIHDKDLDPTVCTKTLSRKRNSLKEKGLLNFSIIKSQDLITGTFKTDGVSYDLSPLEEKLQIISDNIESKREKEIKQHLIRQSKIVETNESSPLETFKKDYLNYYGVEYILNDFEIKKYNSLSTEEKNMIGYIFNYCSDNGLFGKIVPRLSLFFKTKFRFEDLKRYCEENGYNSSQEIINDDIINNYTNNICNEYNVKYNYAFKEAIKRILYRHINKDNTLPNGIEKLFDKAYEDIIGVKKC